MTAPAPAPSIRYLFLAGAILVGPPAWAGEVTPDRFVIGKITGEISVRDISAKHIEHLPGLRWSSRETAFLLHLVKVAAIPFLLIALAFERMTSALAVVKRHFPVIIGVGGAVMILLGVLIPTGYLFTNVLSQAASARQRICSRSAWRWCTTCPVSAPICRIIMWRGFRTGCATPSRSTSLRAACGWRARSRDSF